jgi:methionyl-tRNA formyltransferase
MAKSLRIIFAGTPDFAAAALRAILQSAHEVVGVYTQPDRPAGRGRKLAASPVKQVALEHELPVFQPASLKSADEQETLKTLNADVMVVAAYGLILPQAVIDIPKLGCVNIHASLLPRWRGAAPIQRAILAGDAESGIAIMQMDAGLDTGDVISMQAIPIAADETGGTLHDKLADLGASMIVEALDAIAAQTIQLTPQDDGRATYAHKLSKAEAALDWAQSAQQLERQVRAFNPWPVAQCQLDDKNLRIWSAYALPDQSSGASPGTVIDETRDGIDVATGAGVLRVTQLQMPGKKPQAVRDFLNAHSLSNKTLR